MSKAAQLKARVKNLAAKNHISAQAVLQNVMLERLLERISVSKYKDKFVLKGGMLIASWVGIGSRTTMDMDATLRDYPLSEEVLRSSLSEICAIQLEDETGFSVNTITPIRDDEYGGYRAAIIARYESINTPLKIDITTGDVMTPGAVRYAFRSSFENKTIRVWAYNTETLLAEKVETILSRGVLNTRLRDFYDVYVITKIWGEKIDKQIFTAALSATVQQRESHEAWENREKITSVIHSDSTMRQRWEIYRKENNYAKDIEFDEVVDRLIDFLK